MADELGSGMRNTYKYTKMYSADPQFVEGDIFRITIPLEEIATATVGPGGTVPHDDVTDKIYEMIRTNPKITRKEIGENVGLSAGVAYHLPLLLSHLYS